MDEEKIINGLNKEQWTSRYFSFLKSHTNAEDFVCRESADVAWDYSTDESPEECAEAELENWE